MNKFTIDELDVYRLLNYSKQTPMIASKALKNEIIPFPGFDSTNFDEDMWYVTKEKKYGNSYILYIHTLRVCGELLNHYEETNEIKFFDKAEEIILSWIKYSTKDNHHKMVWYDHTTANRTQVLIQFLYLSQNLEREIDTDFFVELLHQHAAILIDDSIYNYNNHGLMMDRSLMILGNILNEEIYKMKGKYRAVHTFLYSFSSQGVHLENSPQYHKMVVNMYRGIEKYLKTKGDSLGDIVLNYLKLAEEYPPLITKPNNRLASIGDSGNALQTKKKVYKNLYDVEAGLAIIQHENPVPLFTTFVCGYSSRVHKHSDDLSITLNYNYQDFFLDPGKYSYTRNSTRTYITSKEAHSSFYLTEFNYPIRNENRFKRKIKLENYYDNDVYTLVKGSNHDYKGSSAKLTRHVLQMKNYPLIILIDNLFTDVQHDLKLTQKFNLASNVIVNNESTSLSLISDGITLSVKQFNDITDFEIIQGDKKIPIAVNSAGFGKVRESQQLKYENNTNSKNVFLTAIYDENYIRNINLSYKDNELIVQYNDEYHVLYI